MSVTLSVLGWFLVSRLFALTPFMVAGPSMEPTIHDRTLFILDQSAYRSEEPQRGDLVVFSLEDDPNYFYVKRIIGLPGEHVILKNDGLYIQEKDDVVTKIEESYLSNVADSRKDVYMYKPRFVQNFAVPGDKYFVLGDNRRHSLDSRYFKDPYVPKERIKGKYLITLMQL